MKSVLSACLSLGLAVTSLHAQSAETPPVGFNTVLCKSGSDTFVSVAFNRPASFVGVVSSVNASTITVTGTPGWQNNVLASGSGHFVKFRNGTKAGAFFEILSNTESSVTVGLAGDTLSTVSEGDQLAIHPYWSLNDLFPAGNVTIHLSTGTQTFARKTQVLFPNLSGTGVNLAASGIFYQTTNGWHDALNSNQISNPRIEPDQFLIIRHRTQDSDTSFTPSGTVEMHEVRSVLATRNSGSTDNPVANIRPIPVKLKDLGLISSGAFTGSNGTQSFNRRDTLMTFNNAATGLNKSASHIYFYNTATNQWMDALESNRVADNDELLPSTGCIIRKYQNPSSTSALWKHSLVLQ